MVEMPVLQEQKPALAVTLRAVAGATLKKFSREFLIAPRFSALHAFAH